MPSAPCPRYYRRRLSFRGVVFRLLSPACRRPGFSVYDERFDGTSDLSVRRGAGCTLAPPRVPERRTRSTGCASSSLSTAVTTFRFGRRSRGTFEKSEAGRNICPSIFTLSVSFTRLPGCANTPLIVTRSSRTNWSASRREQKPVSLIYLFILISTISLSVYFSPSVIRSAKTFSFKNNVAASENLAADSVVR